jgi:hypothetical protein
MTLTPAEARRRRAFQAAFLRRLGGPQPLRELFDHLSDVAFSLKDRQSRVICASRAVLEKFGMKSELEIVGTTDRDRYPPGWRRSSSRATARSWRAAARGPTAWRSGTTPRGRSTGASSRSGRSATGAAR